MNAYTDRLGFDVVSAPLAEIDRRTLSQAWFSALHLAQPHPRARSSAGAVVDKAGLRAVVDSEQAAHTDASHSSRVVASPRDGRSGAACPAAVGERRAARSSLAEKIVRVLNARRPETDGTSFSLHDGGGRIRIVLRTSGARVHLVAFCTPEAHERVARAIEQARFALARHGVRLLDRLVRCEA